MFSSSPGPLNKTFSWHITYWMFNSSPASFKKGISCLKPPLNVYITVLCLLINPFPDINHRRMFPSSPVSFNKTSVECLHSSRASLASRTATEETTLATSAPTASSRGGSAGGRAWARRQGWRSRRTARRWGQKLCVQLYFYINCNSEYFCHAPHQTLLTTYAASCHVAYLRT